MQPEKESGAGEMYDAASEEWPPWCRKSPNEYVSGTENEDERWEWVRLHSTAKWQQSASLQHWRTGGFSGHVPLGIQDAKWLQKTKMNPLKALENMNSRVKECASAIVESGSVVDVVDVAAVDLWDREEILRA
jgi:hypothetical protein